MAKIFYLHQHPLRMKIIALTNQKEGIGKTTIALAILIIAISLLPACSLSSPDINIVSNLTCSPSPFTPTGDNYITISYTLFEGADASIEVSVKVQIFDINGREVATVFEGIEDLGNHSHTWDGKDSDGDIVAAGSYVCRVRANGDEKIETIIIRRF